MHISLHTAEKVASYRRQDIMRKAAHERLARESHRASAGSDSRRRLRPGIRQFLGTLLVSLGTRLAGGLEPDVIPQQRVTG